MKQIKTVGDGEKDRKNQKGKFSNKTELVKIFAGASGIGFSLIVPLIGGAYLGSYLDRKFNSTPKLTLSLILAGLFIGLYTMYKAVKDIIKE